MENIISAIKNLIGDLAKFRSKSESTYSEIFQRIKPLLIEQLLEYILNSKKGTYFY